MTSDLTQGSIAKHLRQLAIPAATGFFFHTMFNVTDTYFAGKVSTDALAALSLTFPIFFMIISIGAGMSEAVTAVVGNALGSGNHTRAKQVVWHAFIVGAFLSCTLTLIGVFIAPYLMQKLGASGAYLDVSLEYILTLLWASLFFIFSYFLNAMLTAIGDLKSFRNILIVAFFLNILLDYWFVYGGWGLEPLGVRGIAFSTAVTEAMSMFYLGYKLKKSILLQEMPIFTYRRSIVTELIKQGIPPTVNLLLMSTGIFIVTYFAAFYGKDVVAGMGIGMRVEQIALMPALGISISVLALVAQNHGAKAFDRIDKTIEVAVAYAAILSLIGMLLLSFEAPFLVSLFSDDTHVIKEGIIYTQIAALALFGYVLIFTYLSVLQGIEKPSMLLYISLARQIILPLILFTLFTTLAMPVDSLWWGITAIVWCSAAFLYLYTKKVLKKVRHQSSKPHLI